VGWHGAANVRPYDQDHQPKQIALTLGSRDIGMSLAADFAFVNDIRELERASFEIYPSDAGSFEFK
jgi:hypothetical protein